MKKIQVSDITLKVYANELKKELSFREKLAIVNNLQKTGIDTIELPAISCSSEDAVIYKTISESVDSQTVAIACGVSEEDVNCAYECIKGAKNKRLQIVLPMSTVQMEYLYHLKAPKMLDKIATLVSFATKTGAEVEIVAQDATRAEEGFVAKCAKTAFENGASIITLCDDAGIFFPNEFAGLVKEIKEACDIKVFVQPSNKLNMSASTAVEVIGAGADGIKTAVDAKDYLAPNVLAEILRAKGDQMGVKSSLNFTSINKTVASIAEFSSNSNEEDKEEKRSGATFNTDCTIKDIGEAVKVLGYELSVEDTGKVYEEFKRVCSKKQSINQTELEAIVASTAMQVPTTYHLINYVVNSGNIITATANVTLEKEGVQMFGVSTGDGPIDAAFHAIEQIVGHHYELDEFNIQAVTKGREAVGSAIIRLRANGKLYSGNGVSTDIVGACIRAYINALNKIVYTEN